MPIDLQLSTHEALLYSQFATHDLNDILDYIARDNSTAARSFVDDIIETCHLIAENPQMGTRREDLAPALRMFALKATEFTIAISIPK